MQTYSVVSGSAFLHAGSLRLGDILVVGLVLQLSGKVVDRLVQALLQRYLWQPHRQRVKERQTMSTGRKKEST